MITHQQVNRLLEFRDGEALVTSCYLDLDRAKMPPQMLKIRVKDLLQAAHHELAVKAATHTQRESLRADFSRIDEYAMRSIVETQHKGLALFSCSAEKFWQAYGLPRLVRNILIADHEPYVRPLTAILAEYRRFCVIVLDRAAGRLFEVYLGEIAERAEIRDEVPRRVRIAGLGGRDERHIERRHEAAVRQHFQHLADTAFAWFKKNGFDALVLGGHRELMREFKQHLHPYLKERWVGDFQADPARVTPAEVLARTRAIEDQVEWQQESQLAQELVQKAQAGQRAVSGLEATLAAVSRGEAQTLLVEDGYEAPGYVCTTCHFVSLKAGDCPQCGRPTAPCPDVVDETLLAAMHHNCRIEHLRGATALRAAGRIGALLRYQITTAA